MENFRNKIKDVASIGVADITTTGISAIFWFYVASIVGPDNYGQITYFISIAMLSSTIALFGASNTNIVYTAKKIPIQPGILIGYAMSYMPYSYLIIRSFRTEKIHFDFVKDRPRFMIPQYFQTLSGSLSGSLDKLIIASLFGFNLLGNYSLGLQAYALLTLIPTVVVKYIIPQDSSGIENKKLKKMIILSSIGIALLGFTIGPTAISAIFPKFTDAEEVIRIVSFATIPFTIMNVYHSKFYGLEKSKYVLISSMILTSVQVLGIITLGNTFGVNGIASSLVLASSASTVFVFFADKQLKKNDE